MMMIGRDTASPASEPLSAETKRRVRLAEHQRRGFESAWNEYYDCYATTTYLTKPLIKLEDIGYHLYLKKNINPHNPSWELPSFRQQKKTLGLSQDKIQGIEARLERAGLLVKESGKGKGQKGENVSNDYLLYEPKELAEFLLAVTRGEMPGTLNDKGRRKLTELKARFDDGVGTPAGDPVPVGGTPSVPPTGTPGAPSVGTVPAPLSSTHNTRTQTKQVQHTQQQQGATTASHTRMNGRHSVVVAVNLVSLLVARGITGKVARELVRATDASTITHQVAIYDSLREQAPDDPKLSPGRLRRMIEEDWTTPHDFVPPAERVRRAEAAVLTADEQRRRQEAAREEECRRREMAVAQEAVLLAPLGLHAEDQAAWRTLVESPGRLPSAFRDALFYAPRDTTPPVVIFRHRTEHALATGMAYAKHRAEIERRLCDRFPTYARTRMTVGQVVYITYEDALAALRASSEHAGHTIGDPVHDSPRLTSRGENMTTPLLDSPRPAAQ